MEEENFIPDYEEEEGEDGDWLGGGDGISIPWKNGGINCPVDGCRGPFLKTRAKFRRHWREVHSPDVYFYTCPLCDVAVKRTGDLRRHLRKVHGVDSAAVDTMVGSIVPEKRRNPGFVDPLCFTLPADSNRGPRPRPVTAAPSPPQSLSPLDTGADKVTDSVQSATVVADTERMSSPPECVDEAQPGLRSVVVVPASSEPAIRSVVVRPEQALTPPVETDSVMSEVLTGASPGPSSIMGEISKFLIPSDPAGIIQYLDELDMVRAHLDGLQALARKQLYERQTELIVAERQQRRALEAEKRKLESKMCDEMPLFCHDRVTSREDRHRLQLFKRPRY